MILRFDYDKTPQHAREMAVCAEMVVKEKAWDKGTLDAYTALDQFYKGYFSVPTGDEFSHATEAIRNGPPMRILDVGAGRGETSLYLTNHGHQVFPVEPSLEFCQVIEYIGQRFGKELTIYNCSAEHLEIPGELFDVVIFNCSLHHCDDPAMAVKNAYRFLRPGGKLLIINEPILPFFKTHAKYLRDLMATPDESGDYGGNEHNYHYREYMSMISRAGLRNSRSELAARYRSKDAIADSMKVDRRPPGLRKAIKRFYLNLVYALRGPAFLPLLIVMKRLSLVSVSFSAEK